MLRQQQELFAVYYASAVYVLLKNMLKLEEKEKAYPL